MILNKNINNRDEFVVKFFGWSYSAAKDLEGRLAYITPPNHCGVIREQLATSEALIKEIKKHNPTIEISIFALAMAKK